MNRRRAIAGVLCLLLTGCGSTHRRRQPPLPRPITQVQALELARVLLLDYEHAGARVAGTYTVDGQPLDFTGAVDFRNGTGMLSLHQRSLPGQRPRRYWWTRRVVLAQAAPGSREYLTEAPDAQGDAARRLIAFLQLLASPAIDNIELIESSGDLYLGSAGGIDRFREAGRVQLWV
ncbi:MAG: hypothetical protein ACRDL5_13295, partial [Solirubrobacteraceae bacterium]